MAQYNESHVVGELLLAIAVWTLRLLFGIFIICQWLTRLLFEFVVNPLLDGALDRHDGAVVLLSATLWMGLTGLVFFPLSGTNGLVETSPDEWVTAWVASLATGAAMGMIIGVWVLGEWWSQALRHPPAGYEVVRSLGTPLELTSAAPPAIPTVVKGNQQTNGLVSEEEQAQLILGEAVWERKP